MEENRKMRKQGAYQASGRRNRLIAPYIRFLREFGAGVTEKRIIFAPTASSASICDNSFLDIAPPPPKLCARETNLLKNGVTHYCNLLCDAHRIRFSEHAGVRARDESNN